MKARFCKSFLALCRRCPPLPDRNRDALLLCIRAAPSEHTALALCGEARNISAVPINPACDRSCGVPGNQHVAAPSTATSLILAHDIGRALLLRPARPRPARRLRDAAAPCVASYHRTVVPTGAVSAVSSRSTGAFPGKTDAFQQHNIGKPRLDQRRLNRHPIRRVQRLNGSDANPKGSHGKVI